MPNDSPDTPTKSPRNPFKNWIWVYVVVLAFIGGQWLLFGSYSAKETTWQEFRDQMLKNEDVASLTVINGERVEVYLLPEKLNKDRYEKISKNHPGPQYFFNIGSVDQFTGDLDEAIADLGIAEVPVKYEKRSNWLADAFSWIFPIVILVLLWLFLLRRMGGAGGKGGVNPFDFGKSSAKLFDQHNHSQVTFADVAGLDEAKVEIREIVDFLKNPDHYTRLGAKIPKGVMLIGPPGTGKTLLAKAVAGEAQVPFFSISGSEFVEMFVGVGASRVRDLFRKAKEKAPSIIFIDEIDAIGRSRGKAFSLQSNDERESTLNQLLTEMDGFGTNVGVIVLAATNRGDVLDKALLRPGRFDRHINLELPNVEERRAIFRVHIRSLVLAGDIDLESLSAQTPGFSGADIANICNEAALIAARRRKEKIDMRDFMDAVDRIIAGMEKKSKIISDDEKRIVAYHEAGHASLRKLLPNTDPVYKISIIPRGQAAGYVLSFPEEDRGLVTQPWFEDFIAVALGGRVAEELIFDEITDGARDDLDRVTQIARRMVTRFGMSKTLGPMVYGRKQEMVFLGREMSEQRDYSEAIAIEIDREVKAIVDHAYQKARTSLQENIDKLKLVAETLIEIETLTADEFNALWDSDNAAEVLPPPTPQPLPTRPPERRREESRSGGPQTNTPPNPAPSPA